MLLGFGATSAERKDTGKYFILGRFIGLILLGLIISSIGLLFIGFMNYLLILFGIFTIIFGIIIIYNLYRKLNMKNRSPDNLKCNIHDEKDRTLCISCKDPQNKSQHGSCKICSNKEKTCVVGNNGHVCKTIPKSMQHSKLTKRYSLMLGIFRGATPCLKMFIIAPLLIAVDFWLAVGMVIIFAAASSVYTIIGFLSASIITNFRKYESYVQVLGASILIAIGTFTIITRILTPVCAVG